MNRRRLLTVAICTTLSMLDGFDVLVMAFTAPAVGSVWTLTGSQLGTLLSAALAGMALGSPFVAPLADRFGRRPIIILCLVVITVGLFVSAAAGGLTELALARAATGVGIGGMLASLNVLTAESVTERWRGTAVSLQATGYPIGATIGGAIAAVLIAQYGWRAAFMFGGLCSGVMIPVVLFLLPESAEFLASKNITKARQEQPSRHGTGTSDARNRDPAPRDFLFLRLLSPEWRGPTILIWSAFFFLMLAIYFVLSWTPRLLVSFGLSERGGITAGVLLNLGGVIGGAGFAWFATRMDARALTLFYLASFVCLTALFGAVAAIPEAAYITAWGLGIFLFGAMVGLYVLAPALYPTELRTAGMGLALGVGRVGAILSPTVAGILLDSDWQAPQLYFLFTLPLLATFLAIWLLRSPKADVQRIQVSD